MKGRKIDMDMDRITQLSKSVTIAVESVAVLQFKFSSVIMMRTGLWDMCVSSSVGDEKAELLAWCQAKLLIFTVAEAGPILRNRSWHRGCIKWYLDGGKLSQLPTRIYHHHT